MKLSTCILTCAICLGITLQLQGQNVGIGTDTPQRRLHVAQENGTGHVQPVTGLFRLQNTHSTTCPGTVNVWDFRVGNCGQMGLTTYLANATPFFNILKASANDATPSAGPVFSVNVTAPQNTLMLSAEGNVSIGYIPAPAAAAKLDVLQQGAGVIARLRASGTANQWVEIGNGTSAQNLGVGSAAPTAGVPYIWSSQGNFMIGSDGTPNVFVEGMTNTGRVGLGTTSPAHRLHVVGTGFASTDFRAPIFYDSDNTGFFLNPAGTSNVYDLDGRIIQTGSGGYFQSNGTGAGTFFRDRANAARNFGWYAESDAAYLWNDANGIRMSVNVNGGTSISGSDAAYFFQNREGGVNWGWYSSGNIARLWNGSDRLSVDPSGNLRVTEAFISTQPIGWGTVMYNGNASTATSHILRTDGNNAYIWPWGSGTLSNTVIVGGGAPTNLSVNGTLSKAAGSFRIDHPLDPANKYLVHSFVESPDMKNIYDGLATLDAQGRAVVTLPDWFESLNEEFRYQLTAVGSSMPNLHVSQELLGNKFEIAGGIPGKKVSWQLTGIRQDAYAKAYRLPVEEDKGTLRGYYLHPTLHGAPANRAMIYAPANYPDGKLPDDVRSAMEGHGLPQPKPTSMTSEN